MPAQKALLKTPWVLVLAGALLFLAADSAHRLAVFRAATTRAEAGRPAPAFDPRSPTGYRSGERNQILESTAFQRTARKRADHSATVRHLLPLLKPGPALETSDRVALAWELAAGGASDAVRDQLTRCWASTNARDLRRLPPELVPLLLRLTHDFAVTVPPELLALAESLQAGDIPARTP